ncbi:MAG: hypothetical protein HC853_08725 [Anaerolineae bacterium]|nr:hypothetical protein [Anaerolineae bacterium]
MLDEPRPLRAPQFERAQQALTWERAAASLIAFCQNPQRAADRATGEALGNPLYLHRQAEALREAERCATPRPRAGANW